MQSHACVHPHCPGCSTALRNFWLTASCRCPSCRRGSLLSNFAVNMLSDFAVNMLDPPVIMACQQTIYSCQNNMCIHRERYALPKCAHFWIFCRFCAQIRNNLQVTVQKKCSLSFMFILRSSDGAIRRCLSRGSPVLDGYFSYWYKFVRKTTDKRWLP